MAEEKTTNVTLKERQKLGGAWRDAGESVEVYEVEAYGLARRGKIEQSEEDVLSSASFLPAADPFAGANTGKTAPKKSQSKTGE